jgi:hypothetical protein
MPNKRSKRSIDYRRNRELVIKSAVRKDNELISTINRCNVRADSGKVTIVPEGGVLQDTRGRGILQ